MAVDEFKVAVITGATSDIGRAISGRAAASGFTLILCDTDSAVGSLARKLRAGGAEVHCFIHDVSNEEDWVILRAFIEQELGCVHTLINNSNFNGGLSIANGTINDWNRTFEVNVLGAFLGMRALAPLMRGVAGASVINVTANSAFPGDSFAAHSSSKWALRGLTKSAALEFTKWGIRVNAVHQGAVAHGGPAGEALQRMKGSDPGPGPEGSANPEEIAAVVSFLAEADALFLTGVDLMVEGGWSAPGRITACE